MRSANTFRHFGAALAVAALWLSLSHIHGAHGKLDANFDPLEEASALHAAHASTGGPRDENDCPLDFEASVSSDDDHHEHSSHLALALEACFACRSSHDDDFLAADAIRRLDLSERARPLKIEHRRLASTALGALPDTRAPPAISRSAFSIA